MANARWVSGWSHLVLRRSQRLGESARSTPARMSRAWRVVRILIALLRRLVLASFSLVIGCVRRVCVVG